MVAAIAIVITRLFLAAEQEEAVGISIRTSPATTRTDDQEMTGRHETTVHHGMTVETIAQDTAMGPDTNTTVEVRVIAEVALAVPLTSVGGIDIENGNR